MIKKNIIVIAILCFAFSYAQNEASNWYFGENAGIQFDTNTNTVSVLTDGQLNTVEGCTSISDKDTGDLLFYTDGITVYNKDVFGNHQVMQNGNNLFGNPSSTQSAIIVPKPDTPNIYYIFTVDTDDSTDQSKGFHYSIVDMDLDGGLGAVTNVKNVNLLNYSSEKLSAVLQDCESGNIWVVAYANSTGDRSSVGNTVFDTFFRYKITSSTANNGIEIFPPITFNTSPITDRRGYLKFSPDGTKIASANVDNGLFLYTFEASTGAITSPMKINISGANNQPYGVEFSPNSKLLYCTTSNDFFGNGDTNPSNHQSILHQFDLSVFNATAIEDSRTTIDARNLYRSALQLGPDGKIYRSMAASYTQGIRNLSVIDNPNELGTDCDYIENAINLGSGRRSTQGLPPFIASFFSEDTDIIQNGTSTTNLKLCDGDSYTLQAEDIPGATYSWTKDGLPLAESDFDLIVNNTNGPGLYEVVVTTSVGNCGTIIGKANVTFAEIPIANTPINLTACSYTPNSTIGTFNFQTQTPLVLGTQPATQFNVNYFISQDDANNNTNSITGAFQNTTNPQLVYARIDNVDNPNCYDTSFFEIEVYTTPAINNTNDLETCDNDANPTDGQTEILLSSFNPTILGSQDAAQFNITYHQTQADADAGINSHPNNYTNQTPTNETLFIRIENNAKTECYSTGSINLKVNPIPEAFDTEIYQCDLEGAADGFTTFNLNQVSNTITGNNPDVTTQFYLNLNDAQNNTNQINANAFNNTTNPQLITVRVTDNITGCSNYSELTLETSATQINNYSTEVCDELDSEDGLNTFNLNEFSTAILAGLPAGLDISYYDNANDALLENNPLSSPYQNTIPYAQTIYVRVENDNACYGINEVNLTINPRPQLESDETLLYCLNEFPTTLTLDSGLNDTAANYSFNWSSGETTETIAVNTPGTYTVTVTNNATFCEKSRTITVEPSNIATIESIEIIDGNLNNNQITILTSGDGEYQYALIDQDGMSTVFQNSNVFTNVSPGIYNVTIRDIKNNCGTINQDVSVIGFPLYFTPNGDTINDTWQVYGVSNIFQPNSDILIFDRFGKIITKIKPSGPGWDGTYNGKNLPQSDYWFSVTLQDGRTFKGHFTLKR